MHKKRTWRGLVALLLAFGLIAAACGRDETSDGSGGSSTTAGSGSSDTTAGDGQQAGPATTDACDGYDATAGISDSAIKLGSSFPQSGLYAAYAEIAAGWQAQFDTVNEAGGIDGRSIEVVSKDDEYQPALTTSNASSLIEEDGVFGLYSVVGTPNNLAIQPSQNETCVPNLFTSTGAPEMSQPATYPWTIGIIPSYAVEMAAFNDYMKTAAPGAKVAFLYQNDDFGKGYYGAFTKLIEGTDVEIVKEATYDPSDIDVTSQISDLALSDADVLIVGASALACANALGALSESDWDPLTYLSATCTSQTIIGLAPPGAADGVVSAYYLKDPADPQWADDPAMADFQEKGAAAGLDEEQLGNTIVGYGWTSGAILAWVFENSPELTREAVMNTAWHMDGIDAGLLLPGITVTTDGVDDPFPIESMYIAQYNGEYWDIGDELYDFEGKSADFTG